MKEIEAKTLQELTDAGLHGHIAGTEIHLDALLLHRLKNSPH